MAVSLLLGNFEFDAAGPKSLAARLLIHELEVRQGKRAQLALDQFDRGAGIDQCAQNHVAGRARERIKMRYQKTGRRRFDFHARSLFPACRLHESRRGSKLLINDAANPAPKPLSMFTTVTPDEQLFNMARSAARPPKLAPYPVDVGT